MSIEYIEHAAEAIANEVPFLSPSVRRRVAHALDNAGLLVNPEHDAEVAAEALEARRVGKRDGVWWDPSGEDYWRDYWRDRAVRAERERDALDRFRAALMEAHSLLNPTEGDQS